MSEQAPNESVKTKAGKVRVFMRSVKYDYYYKTLFLESLEVTTDFVETLKGMLEAAYVHGQVDKEREIKRKYNEFLAEFGE